jgi:C-terminal processing protease CtpA/Prc
MSLKFNRWILCAWLAAGFFLLPLSSCNNDEPAPFDPNRHVNDWILETMRTFYFWNTSIPADPDRTPAPPDFFKSILDPADRFSWIQENFMELRNQLQGIRKEAGYELVLYREGEATENVLAQILFVKANSPATAAGLKRGDLITHINGQRLTLTNYRELLGKISDNHAITIQSYDYTSQTWAAPAELSLAVVELAENPMLFRRTIDQQGKKVGYLVYRFFAMGPANQFIQEMDQAFEQFLAAGITDFVLDLRFNNGGAASASVNLASLLGRGIDNTKTFYRLQYNENLMNEILNDPRRGEAFLIQTFSSKTQNIGSRLSGGNLYVLTSARTASASEMLINGLRPFMNIISIGGTTSGKDMASVTFYQENDPNNTWGMQPVIARFVNANNQGFANGIMPTVPLSDNVLRLQPLGHENERLLSRALELIAGAPVSGRPGREEPVLEELGNSLDATGRLRQPLIERERLPL